MSLDNYRKQANKILKPIAKGLIGVPPHSITWLAFFLAMLAGYVFYTGKFNLLPLAALFVLLSGFLDALDGTLARVSKLESKRGDFLDHVLDRYADLFILGGLMLSPYVHNLIGFFAIIGVFLTSYMGTQAQALTGKRDLKGLLGRANRLAILIFAPLIYYGLILYGITLPYLNFLEWVLIYFAIVGNLTAIQRAYKIWKKLK